jgi:uncharacterized protein YigE (DUF2233 family)
MMKRLLVLAFGLMAFAAEAQAICKPVQFAQANYTLCGFDTRTDKLALYDLDASGKPYGGFVVLRDALLAQGKELTFAMNAGMFGKDQKPIGYYVEGGKLLHAMNHADGPGNFHLKPNGIFYVAGQKAGVMETEAFARSGIKPDLATQSGPMLLINGALHSQILPSGTSIKIRNGVCVNDGNKVLFAISDDFVTFYQFATMFRDGLHCKNALFLDGSVSSLYAPEIKRGDYLSTLGPMVGVTLPVK